MTSTLRIGQIPFLNCLLFFNGLENTPGVELSPLVPRALSAAAQDGAVDAGPVPLVDTWEIERNYAPLGDFCIATTQRARSVFLFSKVAFDQLDGTEIGITDQTSTSLRLLKVLLANIWNARSARFSAIDRARNDAFLLIGDDALLNRHGAPEFPHMADLGEVWNQWTRASVRVCALGRAPRSARSRSRSPVRAARSVDRHQLGAARSHCRAARRRAQHDRRRGARIPERLPLPGHRGGTRRHGEVPPARCRRPGDADRRPYRDRRPQMRK